MQPPTLPKWAPILFLIVSFAGFLDATYLAAKHFLGSPVTCSLLKGCEVVTSSTYSVMFGIPVALIGALYYLTILILIMVYFDTERQSILRFAVYLTPIGFLASLGFLYLQAFVIKAFCLYCLFSATSSTLLFILGMFIVHKLRQLSSSVDSR